MKRIGYGILDSACQPLAGMLDKIVNGKLKRWKMENGKWNMKTEGIIN